MRQNRSYCLTRCGISRSTACPGGPDPRRGAGAGRPLGRGQDVARRHRPRGRCGRATLYRVFPGGKAHLFDALGQRELHRFSGPGPTRSTTRRSLEDALVVAISASASFATGHEALQFILAHEPGLILPYLGFSQVDAVYRRASALAGPHLVRFLDVEQTPWAVEWVIRLLVSYLLNPAEDTDLTSRTTPGGSSARTSYLPCTASPSPSPLGADMSTSNEELIGRDDVNDLEAILVDHQHRRRRGDPRGEGQRRRHLHLGLREGRPAGAQQALREGQDVTVERRDRPAVGRPRSTREAVAMANADANAGLRDGIDLTGTPFEKWGDKEWVQIGIEAQNWTPQPVHARRAGRAASARPRSSRPCRGSTPSTTRRPR